jgi:hypothetical protein
VLLERPLLAPFAAIFVADHRDGGRVRARCVAIVEAEIPVPVAVEGDEELGLLRRPVLVVVVVVLVVVVLLV